MLWTMIAILTLFLILGLAAQHLHLGQGHRVRWLLWLMFGWGSNAALGSFVFQMVYAGDISIHDYWVWKPLLVGSSIVFMCLGAACFYIVRHVADDVITIFQWKNRRAIKAGVVGAASGILMIGWTWLNIP